MAVTLPWGLRWWELLPEAVLAAGVGLFLLLETSAATSAFKSRTALLLMAAVGVAWLVGRFVLVRYTRRPTLRLMLFAVAAAAVLWIVVLPAFDDTTVVETLPVAAAPAVAAPAATGAPRRRRSRRRRRPARLRRRRPRPPRRRRRRLSR